MLSYLYYNFLSNRTSRNLSFPFLALGLSYGSFAVFIPHIKESFGLNDAELGLLLLALPVGDLIGNPLAGFLIPRKGSLRVTYWGIITMMLSFSILFYVQNLWLFIFILSIVGMNLALTNVAMNTAVGQWQQQSGVKIMSTCHGIFSWGLMCGSLIGGTSFELGTPIRIYFIILSGLLLISWNLIWSRLRNLSFINTYTSSPNAEKGIGFSWPKGALLLMVLISVCTNMVEGSMADWAAIYMKEAIEAPSYLLSWGLSLYASMMALGRLFGDGLISKYGSNSILLTGGIMAFMGLMGLYFLYQPLWCIAAFGLVGSGISLASPILYAASARIPGMKEGVGLSILNTFGVTGFFLGPVIIGFLSNAFSLRIAFAMLSVLMVVWIALSKNVNLYENRPRRS